MALVGFFAPTDGEAPGPPLTEASRGSPQGAIPALWLAAYIAPLAAAIALSCGMAMSAGARTLEELLELRIRENHANADVQAQIEDLANEVDRLTSEHRNLVRQTAALRAFNHQMSETVEQQQSQILELSEELHELNLVSRDVTPLMLRMIDALEKFIALDLPFLQRERSQRIEMLRTTMARSDVTEAEKYRVIMEAYQIENDYGRTIEAYRSDIPRGGKTITVDLLRIGRVALYYHTLDSTDSAIWSQDLRAWIPLEPDHNPSIAEALRIARKQQAPDLLRLPLPVPGDRRKNAGVEDGAPNT